MLKRLYVKLTDQKFEISSFFDFAFSFRLLSTSCSFWILFCMISIICCEYSASLILQYSRLAPNPIPCRHGLSALTLNGASPKHLLSKFRIPKPEPQLRPLPFPRWSQQGPALEGLFISILLRRHISISFV